MSQSSKQIDDDLRQNLEQEAMTPEEVGAVWQRVEEGASTGEDRVEGKAKGGRGSIWLPVRPVLAGLGLALVLIAVAAVAIGPGGDSENGPAGPGLTSLASAKASEVLDQTAESARQQPSLMPGPGQALFSRVTQWTDPDELGVTAAGTGPAEISFETFDEWIDAEGQGIRADGYHSSASGSSDHIEYSDPNLVPFDASSRPDAKTDLSYSWRSVFSLRDLEAMPTEPKQALDQVRQRVVEFFEESDEAEAYEAGIIGSDLAVLISVSNLLMQAPLTGTQRAVLYELLATAPDWYRNEGSAKVEVTNKGIARAHGGDRAEPGREGILISALLKLSKEEGAMVALGARSMQYEILLDPVTGEVLETRLIRGDADKPMIWFTSEVLKLVDRAEMEPVAPDGRDPSRD